MKPYVVKNTDFLKFFANLRPLHRTKLIHSLDRNQINTISEICKKILKKNLTTCPKIIKKLTKAKKQIKSISLKTTPLSKKKKILQSRTGGAILSVLLPIAASLIGSLISR